jgi:hypothetical protein
MSIVKTVVNAHRQACSKNGKYDALKFLLASGADPNLADDWGITPLLEAVQQNYHRILELLLLEDRVLPFHKVDKTSTLHAAVLHSDLETIRLLTTCNKGAPGLISGLKDSPTPPNLFGYGEYTDTELGEAFGRLPNMSGV